MHQEAAWLSLCPGYSGYDYEEAAWQSVSLDIQGYDDEIRFLRPTLTSPGVLAAHMKRPKTGPGFKSHQAAVLAIWA